MNPEGQFIYIGTVHSTLQRIEDCPKQENEGAPAARIELFTDFTPGGKNIRPGDEIILLTWLHLADRSPLETRPRDNPNAPITGVFSTRSPNRPNPVGMHRVKVLAVLQDNSFTVGALEVLDRTPVIDIKPA